MKHFEVIVLGAGSAGEIIASTLAGSGKKVAMIEKLRVGGECAYLSCMPSKAMLRSAQVRKLASSIVNLGGASADLELGNAAQAFAVAAKRRDVIVENRDDSQAASNALKSGVELVRGKGVFTSGKSLEVSGEIFTWDNLVISTGSSPTIPELKGLDSIAYWTSDDALSALEAPQSVLIIGGGPVACELAQIFVLFGAKVSLVESGHQLAGREHPLVASKLADSLKGDGVEIYIQTQVESVESIGSGRARVHLSTGKEIEVERVIVATGRHPETSELRLEQLGVSVGEKGELLVDEYCRVIGTKDIWAAGDVTGIAPFTHTANYQGRIIANNILGAQQKSSYLAIPRAIYTDPTVASVGVFKDPKVDDGLISAEFDLSQLSRSSTDGTQGGLLILTADEAKGVLVGAAAIGQHAEEWISEAILAIRAQIPLELLCDLVHPFPTYSQAFEAPLQELLTKSREIKTKVS